MAPAFRNEYDSYGAFVEQDLPPRVAMEARDLPGTTARLFRFHGTQPLPDPAVPEVTVHLMVGGRIRYAADFSFGRFEGTKRVGEFDVVPPGTRGLFEAKGTFELLTWSLPWSEVQQIAEEAGIGTIFDLGRLHSRMSACPLLGQVLQGLWGEAAEPRPLGRLFRHAAVQTAALQLLRLSGERPAAPTRAERGGLAAWQLRRTTEYMRERLDEDVGIDTLAAIANLSPFHFARAFKRSTGMPPCRYHQLARLDRAKDLLANTDLSVMEVALAVGYETPRGLSQLFRRETGLTPGGYRHEHRS